MYGGRREKYRAILYVLEKGKRHKYTSGMMLGHFSTVTPEIPSITCVQSIRVFIPNYFTYACFAVRNSGQQT